MQPGALTCTRFAMMETRDPSQLTRMPTISAAPPRAAPSAPPPPTAAPLLPVTFVTAAGSKRPAATGRGSARETSKTLRPPVEVATARWRRPVSSSSGRPSASEKEIVWRTAPVKLCTRTAAEVVNGGEGRGGGYLLFPSPAPLPPPLPSLPRTRVVNGVDRLPENGHLLCGSLEGGNEAQGRASGLRGSDDRVAVLASCRRGRRGSGGGRSTLGDLVDLTRLARPDEDVLGRRIDALMGGEACIGAGCSNLAQFRVLLLLAP